MRLCPAIAMCAIFSVYPTIGMDPTMPPGYRSDSAVAPPTAVQHAEAAPAPIPTDVVAAPAGSPPQVINVVAPPPDAVVAGEEDSEVQPQERVLVVSSGDTLAGLLDAAGIETAEAHAAIDRLRRHFRPSSLRPGDEIAIRLVGGATPALLEIEFEPEPGRTVRVTRRPDGAWEDEETIAPRTRFLVRAEGTVDGGLFPAMTRSGVPAGMALSLIRVLSHQVDFQRDLKPGDSFSLFYERIRQSDGDILGHGQVLKATLVLSGRRLEIWRFKKRDGDTGWYDGQGRSLRRSFLRTPLDGARISSGYGMRSHPILGYTRMHQGVDFAAPTGTPVYAAGDGTIVSAKREGGYGLMVRIRHASGVQTRYAHLSRFARNSRAGQRVRQGAVIGYVGSTGMSTGPHLHYEIALNGRTVNPSRHVQPPVRLAGANLNAFRARQRELERLAARFDSTDEIALAAN